jgi:DNA-binding response OmpR family regulator
VTSSPFAVPFLIGRHDPDLVLIDLSMPSLSGNTLLSDLRARVFKTDAALILFSGRGAAELSELCETLGANDFIAKGGELDVALDRVRFWINYRSPSNRKGDRS